MKNNLKNLFLELEPTLDIEGMGAFFKVHFLEKWHFVCFHPPKQMSFLTISNENMFLKLWALDQVR